MAGFFTSQLFVFYDCYIIINLFIAFLKKIIVKLCNIILSKRRGIERIKWQGGSVDEYLWFCYLLFRTGVNKFIT